MSELRNMKVPFFRPSMGQAEISEVVKCIESGWLTTGPNAAAFEKEFCAVMGGDVHAICVNSATAALHLGLDALGVGPGDEVIVPTLTFTATAEVVRYMGADPVFVDMDPDTLCLDIDALDSLITAKTKVIMPVHFAGRPCNITRIREIADAHGLSILDDAAHALPAYHGGKIIGDCNADMTAFSFYANKTMTTGEGGMLVTRNPDLAHRAKVMRLHGIDRDVFNRFTDTKASWAYDVVAPGYKYNLTDIAAAMGRVQLGRIEEFIQKRRDRVARYNEAFADLPVILPPEAAEGDVHSWHLYILRVREDAAKDRDALDQALKAAHIGTSVHYCPLHQMSFWKPYADGRSFPAADAYIKSCLSIPLFMDMTDAEQDYVIANIVGAFRG